MLQLKRRIFARNVIGLLHARAIAEFRSQPGSNLHFCAMGERITIPCGAENYENDVWS